MSDLIKTSLSLENCSFHPRGKRSWAGPKRLKMTWRGKRASRRRCSGRSSWARRYAGSLQALGSSQRRSRELGFLGIHHLHPLRSRHFIMRDHSVKQYDAAHFYLSRFTKSPFSLAQEQQKPRRGAAKAPRAGKNRRRGPRRADWLRGPGSAQVAALGCGPAGTRLSPT